MTVNLTIGTRTFTGTHTYNGPTTVTGGTLSFTAGSLDNTAISVTNPGIFAVRPGTGSLSAGHALTLNEEASLSLTAGGTLSMVDGAIGTFNVVQDANYPLSALNLNTGNFALELSSSSADQVIISGGVVNSTISGINTINLTVLGSTLTPGTYPLITAPGISNTSPFFFPNGTASHTTAAGGTIYILSLSGADGVESLTVAMAPSLIWTGRVNGTGAANSTWSLTPGSLNFASATPTAVNYIEPSAAIFQDVNPITGTNVTNGTVTLDAGGVQPITLIVNNSAVNYTFQNAGGTIGITGTTGLNKSGTGTLTLLGVNSFTGPIALNGGIVNLGVAEGAGVGPLGTGGNISFGGGTLQLSAANTSDYSARFSTASNQDIRLDTNGQNASIATGLISPGGTLTQSGTGTLTLTSLASLSIHTYSGATTVNGGILKLVTTDTGTQGVLAGTPSITVNTAGELLLESTAFNDVLGSTVGKEALIINGGGIVTNNSTNTRITLANPVTMTAGTLRGTSMVDSFTGAYSFNATPAVIAVSDTAGTSATISANVSTQTVSVFQIARGGNVTGLQPDLVISGPITNFVGSTNGIIKTGLGILTLSGANTYLRKTTLLGGTTLLGHLSGLGDVWAVEYSHPRVLQHRCRDRWR